MIDVVYPLGKAATGWKHDAIKYSLRSLCMYAEEAGWRVFVVGEAPSVLDYRKVIHIPFKETKAKEINILEKAVAAARDSRVSEEFFFINDDYFFLRPFSLTNFPQYHKGDIRGVTVRNGYDRMMMHTADALERDGFTAWHYDIHTPHRLLKPWVEAAYKHFYNDLPMGALSTVLNHAGVEGEYKRDTKIQGKELGWLKENRGKELMFSVFDNAQTADFKAFMDELYPEKCYFEA